MGSLGIIVHYATNGYQGSNKTSLRFEAKDDKIHIGDKVTLDARGIHSLVFRNNKMFITEAESGKKIVYPSVTVNMDDVGLHFTIRFVGEHLDIYWDDVAAQSPEASGLIGMTLCIKVLVACDANLLGRNFLIPILGNLYIPSHSECTQQPYNPPIILT